MTLIGPLKLKAQIFCGEEVAMGPGKADLLEAIEKQGSISAAGRALGMSYRRTWLLVDTMNRCWREPLVATATGGARGGGARLTTCGRKVLDAFRLLERQLAGIASDRSLEDLTALMLDRPRSSQVASSACAMQAAIADSASD